MNCSKLICRLMNITLLLIISLSTGISQATRGRFTVFNKDAGSGFGMVLDDIDTDRVQTAVTSLNSDRSSKIQMGVTCENSEEARKCSITGECFHPKDLLFLQDVNAISKVHAEELCLPTLREATYGECSRIVRAADNETESRPTSKQVWGYGFLMVTIISIISLGGVVILPVMRKDLFELTLTFFVSLGVGALAGSGLFHLLPVAFGLDAAGHDYLYLSMVAIGGIYVFFFSDQMMRLVSFRKKRAKEEEQDKINKTEEVLRVAVEESTITQVEDHKQQPGVLLTRVSRNSTEDSFVFEPAPDNKLHSNHAGVDEGVQAGYHWELHDHTHQHAHEHVAVISPEKKPIENVAWMILFGDGLHNFVDGVAIGSAMTVSIVSGVGLSIAVFCEEFPHELGDFAILVNAGMSYKFAAFTNFLAACTCYLGLVVGILLGELDIENYIFAFAGGMFMYIALTAMMPELSAALELAVKERDEIRVTILQNIGLWVGLLILFFLSLYGGNIEIGG